MREGPISKEPRPKKIKLLEPRPLDETLPWAKRPNRETAHQAHNCKPTRKGLLAPSSDKPRGPSRDLVTYWALPYGAVQITLLYAGGWTCPIMGSSNPRHVAFNAHAKTPGTQLHAAKVRRTARPQPDTLPWQNGGNKSDQTWPDTPRFLSVVWAIDWHTVATGEEW